MTDLLHFLTSVQWLYIGLKLQVVKYMYVYQTNYRFVSSSWC